MRAYCDWPPVRWSRAHRDRVDVVVAVVAAGIAVAIHVANRSTSVDYRDPQWWSALLIAASCAPLAWRRSHPIFAAAATVGMQLIIDVARLDGPGWMAACAAVYCLGSYSSGRRRTIATAAIAAVVVGALAIGLWVDDETVTLGAAFGLVSLLAICFLVGDVFRRRRNEMSALAARAERAELERELLAGQRVAEERTRIARDLHDVVAHSVSVMVIQATAARRNLERDPATAAELLENVEATGRRTMGELRQILGVLRDSSDDVASTAVLRDVDSLVRSIPDLDVSYTHHGSLADVPAGVALSAYRVVQEALTNAHRHGGPRVKVDVVVDCTPEHVSVSVADDGRGASTQTRNHGGYGLIGMGERVAAFGGQLRTGPRRSGGWEVRAQFPLRGQDRYDREPPPQVATA